MIKIGKIVNTHGIKGEVRIRSNSDFKELRFKVGNELFIKERNGNFKQVTIAKHYPHKTFDIVLFNGYDNINLVEQYKNYDIYAPQITAEDLEDEEYLNSDLVDCKVYEDNNYRGKVLAVVENPSSNLLRVEYENKKYLIPFVGEFVIDVDIKTKRIDVKLMEGLI